MQSPLLPRSRALPAAADYIFGMFSPLSACIIPERTLTLSPKENFPSRFDFPIGRDSSFRFNNHLTSSPIEESI